MFFAVSLGAKVRDVPGAQFCVLSLGLMKTPDKFVVRIQEGG